LQEIRNFSSKKIQRIPPKKIAKSLQFGITSYPSYSLLRLRKKRSKKVLHDFPGRNYLRTKTAMEENASANANARNAHIHTKISCLTFCEAAAPVEALAPAAARSAALKNEA
jgi:hypothetical protein